MRQNKRMQSSLLLYVMIQFPTNNNVPVPFMYSIPITLSTPLKPRNRGVDDQIAWHVPDSQVHSPLHQVSPRLCGQSAHVGAP